MAGGAVESNNVSCFESFCSGFGADNTGNPQFATDNGGVRGLTTFVGNDAADLFHGGDKIRRSHLGNQNMSFFSSINVFGVVDDNDRSRSSAGRSGVTGQIGCLVNGFLLVEDFLVTDDSGNWAGLDDVDAFFFNGKFYILGFGVVVVKFLANFGNFDGSFIADGGAILFVFWYLGFFGFGDSFDQLDFLFNDIFASDFPSIFVNNELIGSNGALDHIFSQAPSGFNDDLGFVIINRIDSEHNAGNVRLDLLLDRNSHAGLKMTKFLFVAIENGSRSEKAGPTVLDSLQNIGLANDIEEGFLLAGK